VVQLNFTKVGYFTAGAPSDNATIKADGVYTNAGYIKTSASSFQVGATVTFKYSGGQPYSVTFLGYTVGAKFPVISAPGRKLILGAASNTANYTFRAASLACYLRGTLIVTDEGEKPVEKLREGDLIQTRFGGLRPLKWLGHSRVAASSLAGGKMPVCISAGAIADSVPRRDLWVTAEHNVMIGDRLVTAELLVNGASITQPPRDGMVEIYHLDFGVHDCVLAEGLWADSFADRHNRNQFQNYAAFLRANPGYVAVEQEFCLPLLAHDSPELPGIRADIVARIPEQVFSSDPDLHLLADGQRIDPCVREDGRWEFDLDRPAATLVLRSRVQVPEIIGIPDGRRLGIRLHRIEVHGSLGTVRLGAGSAALASGVHEVEGTGLDLWRWTSGDVVLPPYGRQAPLWLVVYGAGLGRYVIGAAGESGDDMAGVVLKAAA
jgi:hypothetical protein